jgi:hypothetical protein
MKPFVALAFLAVAGGWICACSPPPQPVAPKPAATPVAASAKTAKKATMICRNSQTGAKAECGTPNAVMVGIKTE